MCFRCSLTPSISCRGILLPLFDFFWKVWSASMVIVEAHRPDVSGRLDRHADFRVDYCSPVQPPAPSPSHPGHVTAASARPARWQDFLVRDSRRLSSCW